MIIMIVLKKGARGALVRWLQRRVKVLADGVFGQVTEEAVRVFQKEHGLVCDGVVGAATWSKLLRGCWKRSCRRIDEIIVHCTATREGVDVRVEDIRKWHRAQGWSDIGYHYVVGLDGVIEAGRDVDIAGAHCQGHNARSIGVVYVGGLAADGRTPKDTRTEAQKESLVTLLSWLMMIYPNAMVHGHNEFANKACPCYRVRTPAHALGGVL